MGAATFTYVRRMLWPPLDRTSRLTRAGLTCGLLTLSSLPWYPNTDDTAPYLWARSGVAFGGAVLMLLSVAVPRYLPRLIWDPAIGLAMFSFLTHGFLAIFYEGFEETVGSRWGHGFFAFGAWLICLSQALDWTELIRVSRIRDEDEGREIAQRGDQ